MHGVHSYRIYSITWIENDEIDKRLMKIYALVHEYGDDDTKAFVEQLPYFNKRV